MSDKIQLNLQPREPGKRAVKKVRAQGLIPVVIYGNNKENQYACVEDLNFRKAVFPNVNALFELKTPKGVVSALARNIDMDTLNNKVIHADFYAVDANTEIAVFISLHFEGEPVGLKHGGAVNKVLEEIEVECLPSDIPESIHVDISHLDIDDRILVSDLVLPPKVSLLTDAEETVLIVSEHVEQADAEPVSAAEGTEAAAAAPAATETPAADGDKS